MIKFKLPHLFKTENALGNLFLPKLTKVCSLNSFQHRVCVCVPISVMFLSNSLSLSLSLSLFKTETALGNLFLLVFIISKDK